MSFIALTCILVAIDGDTLRCGEERIRLLGIDAPELPGHCQEERECVPGDPFASKKALESAVRGPAMIKRQGQDTYGRTLAGKGRRSRSVMQADQERSRPLQAGLGPVPIGWNGLRPAKSGGTPFEDDPARPPPHIVGPDAPRILRLELPELRRSTPGGSDSVAARIARLWCSHGWRRRRSGLRTSAPLGGRRVR